MDELRENCPWDKKQTLESLRHAYHRGDAELSDAILEGDLTEVEERAGRPDAAQRILRTHRFGQKGALTYADVLEFHLREAYRAPPAHLWRRGGRR